MMKQISKRLFFVGTEGIWMSLVKKIKYIWRNVKKKQENNDRSASTYLKLTSADWTRKKLVD